MFNVLKIGLILSLLIFSLSSFAYELNPPAHVTGSLCTTNHRDFSEFRYDEKIPYCQRNVSNGLKSKIYKLAGISESDRRNYTIDHFIQLSCGGDNSINNLWAEHKNVKNHRLGLEYDLYRALRDGCIKQAFVVEVITENKYNPMVMQLPTYRSFETLGDYLNSRGYQYPDCTQTYLTVDSM